MTTPRAVDTRWHRRSIRLKGYDYSQPGAYFVTIVARGRECVFGDVVDDHAVLTDAGRIVQACWDDLPNHYAHVRLDAFVVMPNHIHGIILLIAHNVGAGLDTVSAKRGCSGMESIPLDHRSVKKPAPTHGRSKRHALSEIVRGFKTFSARRINRLRRTPGTAVWQRNYYEHIVRGEDDLRRIRQYIADNAQRWPLDAENPSNVRKGR